ncbi:triphosphoribosyl-dephospho-CoA synthase [Methylomarinovum caldicuralii]|uniref:Triphosphoribosyl-dephospho-CoA synthase n=1 Tax=Methylomarinovum caldicuralii TaxID=438856 RepID=A0AAU9C8Q6_9GAMM|nr:triphosphoribosyl-dephospho-CoA synthase [Methylomarinovum caldicuralii]BCX81861.1 triphosphoribosyl-dephospho-CoA synthase [Methylomarinovum caldicuralii]
MDSVLEACYREACRLDVEAFKPGNVSVYAEGHGMRVAHFLRSAEVSAPWLCRFDLSLGERIYRAMRATLDAVGCNTNLGIVLLAAPLLAAASQSGDGNLRDSLRRVLTATTREDAAWVYRAIREVEPGGLGRVAEGDVREEPRMTLREAMALAKNHDRVAFNYTFYYKDIYTLGIPRYHNGVYRWGDERWATVLVFTALLRRIPDTHVERKFGKRFTEMIQAEMLRLESLLLETDTPEALVPAIRAIDARFKREGINPGTTADLTVTTLLAVRLEKWLSSAGSEAGRVSGT